VAPLPDAAEQQRHRPIEGTGHPTDHKLRGVAGADLRPQQGPRAINAGQPRLTSKSPYFDDELVGVAVAFRGDENVHSHIVGVHPRWQGNGLGHRIKRHQGEWALAQGLKAIRGPSIRSSAVTPTSTLDCKAERLVL
jgi:GNAT superfamily N-acetyltransferase